MSPRAYVVMCPFPDAEQALEASRRAVEADLAACAQTLSAPISSVYRWEGELREETEVLVLLKTSTSAWPRLRELLLQLHPYDVPEILACPAEGSEAYLRWLEACCTREGDVGAGGGKALDP